MKSVEELLDALQALLDGAKAEDRDLTPDELQRSQEIEKEIETRKQTVELRSRVEKYRAPVAAVVATKTKEDDVEERAFSHYIKTGLANQDLMEARAQSVGTDSAGGYLVPQGFLNRLTERMKDFGGLANHVETINTATGQALEWPTNDDTGNAGEIVAEAATFANGADVTFGTKTLGAYKYGAGGASNLPVRLSIELIQDSAFDIENWLVGRLSERIARAQAPHWVSGNGTSQPEGIVTGVDGVQSSGTALAYADFVTWVHSVDPAYRSNAKWAFNDSTLAEIRKLEDQNGRPLWQPSVEGMSASMPGGTLLGYPVVIDQAFADMNLAGSAVFGVFGDLKESYIIRRVSDVSVMVDPYSRGANGQVQYHAFARADGRIKNSNSYIGLAGTA